MKILTSLLQKMVSKAIQGASNNKNLPLTSLMGIEAKGDILTLTTIDGSNIFKVRQVVESVEDFYTIVNADTFAKLIGKTTTEYITLENKENYLEFRGNGTNKFEIAINEEGEMVRFPEIKDIQGEGLSLNLPIIQEQIKTAKASVAKTMELPCLTGYYIGNNIITTDRELICSIKNLEMKEPILISNEMAELILLIDGAEILEIVKKDNDLILYTDKYTIAGKELEGKENYPVQQIEDLLQTNKYENTIKVNKQELLNVLSRLSIFISDYDKNGVYLQFSNDGLTLQSQKSNAIEVVEAIEKTEIKSFNCLIDIDMLKSQVETVSTDMIEIQYGQEKSIKITDGNCTHIISLLEKSN